MKKIVTLFVAIAAFCGFASKAEEATTFEVNHCAQRKLTDTQFPQPESQEYSEENGKFGAFPELVENPFHNQVV